MSEAKINYKNLTIGKTNKILISILINGYNAMIIIKNIEMNMH